jgi:hypothetical protein
MKRQLVMYVWNFWGGMFQKGGCIRYKTLSRQDARCFILCCNLKMTDSNTLMFLRDLNVMTLKAVDMNMRMKEYKIRRLRHLEKMENSRCLSQEPTNRLPVFFRPVSLVVARRQYTV